jgi:energy-coupling factor transporter ATP-binding protein EcfA2
MRGLMKENLHRSTRYFKTYEEREEAFRKSVFSIIPRKYSGPRLFWKDFGRISTRELSKLIQQPVAYITSNPRDCLAFGTPWQVLTAVRICAQKTNKDFAPSAEKIARDFNLQENLYQPIRTLSGGEAVKLALAKSFISAKFSSRLIIASPFSWLSRDNTIYFKNLVQHYIDLGLPIELLALEGEDSKEQIEYKNRTVKNFGKQINFIITLNKVRISLSSSLNPMISQETYALVENLEAELLSPCLIIGDNGQGKSLIAKVLAGAIPFEGTGKILCESKSGPARLLFQDVITQTLLRSFDAIAASPFRMDEERPMELYEKILKEYLFYLDNSVTKLPEIGSADTSFRTLLEIKLILVAVRLCGQPCAIILDEPDWGLNRTSAIAFVSAIIEVAHSLGTPVFLISHKPWWQSIANSTILVRRSPKVIDREKNYFFQIELSCSTTKSTKIIDRN